VRFPDAEYGEGVTAASPLSGFDKNDIMRAVELGILGLVAVLILFFVIRPVMRSAAAGMAAVGTALVPSGGGGPMAMRVVTTPDGQTLTVDQAGQPLALPSPDIEQKLDIARIEGQVKASSVKRVAEFVDKHPEESVSILRTWLHESA
jgi:flagellar M-ring protein FliF